jgi:lysophospholipase L1-like esterase
VEVAAAPRTLGSVVALGDSITDGVGSQTGANARWPNALARRLHALPEGAVGVVDAGIGGNRVLESSPIYGVDALARFKRDVLDQAGVRTVIVLEGLNDIGFSRSRSPLTFPHATASAAQLIGAYQQLIAEAHSAGIKILGGTLTPFRGARYWSPAGEAEREAINRWVRRSGAFDGVIDFARAVADPGHPTTLNPAYDSGDHLHLNDAGYRAMAGAISLRLLILGLSR